MAEEAVVGVGGLDIVEVLQVLEVLSSPKGGFRRGCRVFGVVSGLQVVYIGIYLYRRGLMGLMGDHGGLFTGHFLHFLHFLRTFLQNGSQFVG